MKRFWQTGVVLALLVPLILSGCSADNAPSSAEARRTLCQTLNSLREATSGLSQIDANTSVSQLRDMRERVGRWVEAARLANTVLQLQQITEMVNAFDSFSRAVDTLNPDVRVGAATAGLQASSAQILTAFNQAYRVAQCSQ
ncbi:hypothetical protein [Caldilinea sp.]|uniref:hypothetical protein n=1 Tax=Caldilinea sp. TaxID=2293560 RepID=UPI0021DEDBA5|nr:hypothetical protein [Caldilinea sp.]GIV75020.1 MAG: hypothetical protein KatS3mg049_3576 [Caldilinea sp.]